MSVDRLTTVSWRVISHPTSVVNRFSGLTLLLLAHLLCNLKDTNPNVVIENHPHRDKHQSRAGRGRGNKIKKTHRNV